MKDLEKGYWMGSCVGIAGSVIGVIVFVLASKSACAQTSFENNPMNFKNSQYNFDNSQYDYRNSKYNWDNSSYNMDSKSGIYSNDGSRIGYEVQNLQGTRNIYDNNGNRVGYGK
jgi:hypothetical protein